MHLAFGPSQTRCLSTVTVWKSSNLVLTILSIRRYALRNLRPTCHLRRRCWFLSFENADTRMTCSVLSLSDHRDRELAK